MWLMSNEQWNTPQPGGQWQQPGQDWQAPQQPHPEWGTQQQAAPGWAAPGQPGQPGQPVQEWGPQGQPQWQTPGQAAPGQGVPGQGVPGYGQGMPPQPQWQPAPRPSTGFGNVFDFSFRKLALPSAAGTIFLVASICFAVVWMFELAAALYNGYGLLDALGGGLARLVIGLLAFRILLEIATFLSRIAANTVPKDDDAETPGGEGGTPAA